MCGLRTCANTYNIRDAAYTDALTVLKTPVTQEVSKRDAKTRLEDYYRMIRTWLVLFWIMSNAVLALVISSDYINGLLEPSNQDELEDENLAKHMYLTHWYFIAVLWCIAAMALVRFIGSFIYLVQYTFSRGR
jgi:chitin synthase